MSTPDPHRFPFDDDESDGPFEAQPGSSAWIIRGRLDERNRKFVRRDMAKKEAEAAGAAERIIDRWPLTLNVRSFVIKTALGLCGLELVGEGPGAKVLPIEGGAPPDPSIANSAMRVLASYDKLSLAQYKLEIREEKIKEADKEPPLDPFYDYEKYGVTLTPEAEDQCWALVEEARAKAPIPPSPHWKKKSQMKLAKKALAERWPITLEMRSAIIITALNLCGYSTNPAGEIIPLSPAPKDPPKPRIVASALGVIATFDRLSLEHREIELTPRPTDSFRNDGEDLSDLPEDVRNEVQRIMREDKERTYARFAAEILAERTA